MENYARDPLNDINVEKTAEAKADPKYIKFLKWFKDNKGKSTNVDFPVIFGDNLCGVLLKKDLQAQDVLLEIPNNLLLSSDKVMNSELSHVFKSNDKVFTHDDEGEIMAFTLFLMFQVIKGEESFWFPFINVASSPDLPSFWTTPQIQELQEPQLIHELRAWRTMMKHLWTELKGVCQKYPHLFPLDKVDEHLFIELYHFVLSRGFDRYEDQLAIDMYGLVTSRNFGHALPSLMLVPFGDFLNHASSPVTFRLLENSLKSHHELPSSGEIEDKAKAEKPKKTKAEAKTISKTGQTAKVIKSVKGSKKTKDEKIEVDCASTTVEDIELKKLCDLDNKSFHIWHLGFYEEDDEDDDYPEFKSEDEYEDEEEKKEEQHDQDQYEYHDYVEGENYFPWWKWNDPNIVLKLYTTQPLAKNKQALFSYGRRSNHYFILNYGFSTPQNKYNFYQFRVRKNVNPREHIKDKLRDLILPDDDADFLDGKYAKYYELKEKEEMEEELRETTQLIKLKTSTLNKDLLYYFRFLTMEHYTGPNKDILLMGSPVEIQFEIEILNYAVSLLLLIMHSFPTSLEFDTNLLTQALPDRTLRAVQYRISFKEVIENQIRLLKILIGILKRMEEGVNLKEAYLGRFEDLESEKDVIENRGKLRYYLKDLANNREVFLKIQPT